jgi:DNA-binding response OmpR family regulator
MRVLIVEDDKALADGLTRTLKQSGYAVDHAATGELALRACAEEHYDLIVLDISLGGIDGFEVLRQLRRNHQTGSILILTAHDSESDRVRGLDLGADDYVTKPFSITELLARIRAVLRRAGGRPSGLETCRIGNIEIDFRTHQAHRAGERIDFTAREFDLLRYLVAHTGQVVTREQILNQVWGYEESPTTRTIDNFVAKLRQKIETSPHEPEHILTVHGAGYKFVG